MEKEKFNYIKVSEYIKDSVNNGFFPIGYFDQLETWLGVEGFKGEKYILSTVSDKKVAKRYKSKTWAKKKIKEIYNLTKTLEYFYPYDENTYKYKFEIVEE